MVRDKSKINNNFMNEIKTNLIGGQNDPENTKGVFWP